MKGLGKQVKLKQGAEYVIGDGDSPVRLQNEQIKNMVWLHLSTFEQF